MVHIASSSGSCSGLASAIVLQDRTKLTGIIFSANLNLEHGSVSIRVDERLYWPSDQDRLYTFRDIEDVEVQVNPVVSHHEGEQLGECLDFPRSGRRSTSGAYERRSGVARVRCDLPEFWT